MVNSGSFSSASSKLFVSKVSVMNQIICIGTSIMRPCNNFVDLIQNIKGSDYQFNVVPFNDYIDCFVSPCGSTTLLMNYGFLPISTCNFAIALSKKHILAKKEILNFEDLHNYSLLLLKRGNSYVIDEMRDDIFKHHPSINIIDFDGYYDNMFKMFDTVYDNKFAKPEMKELYYIANCIDEMFKYISSYKPKEYVKMFQVNFHIY